MACWGGCKDCVHTGVCCANCCVSGGYCWLCCAVLCCPIVKWLWCPCLAGLCSHSAVLGGSCCGVLRLRRCCLTERSFKFCLLFRSVCWFYGTCFSAYLLCVVVASLWFSAACTVVPALFCSGVAVLCLLAAVDSLWLLLCRARLAVVLCCLAEQSLKSCLLFARCGWLPCCFCDT
jgi:hypothetical protein